MKQLKYGGLFCIIMVLLVGFYTPIIAQDISAFGANDYFNVKDYNRALVLYLKEYKKNSQDMGLNLNIGICYLNINDDKTKSLPYLEKVYNAGNYKSEVLLYLGQAYMHDQKFDEAIRFFNDYNKATGNKDAAMAERYISNCENAKVLVQTPKNVEFVNLGKNINSKSPDFYPFITQNEGTLFFTSGRETNEQKMQTNNGFYTCDIYVATANGGEWSKAKGIGKQVNTAEDEQCVYVTPDGSTMILYMDNQTENQVGDLFKSSIANSKSFSKPERFEEPVNTKSLETEGCITLDGNCLIVASNRPGGEGESDLYMFKKLPKGDWGMPINLGTNINTKYNENFPIFDEETNTLYFASQGHNSMGGFDIFKSAFDPNTQTFGPSVNMGYPVNTTEDNMQFTLAGGNKRTGFISAYRKEGFGDLDIYKLVFNDIEPKLSIVKGVISAPTVDSAVSKPMNAFVTISDAKTKEEIGRKNINPSTGKFVFALKPGKYTLTVTSSNGGFSDYQKQITVYEKPDNFLVIENDIVLQL